jgi:hypothetical protein
MEREYLISIAKDPLAREEAVHHNGTPGCPVTLAHDKFAISERLDRMRHVRKYGAVLLRYAENGLQARY